MSLKSDSAGAGARARAWSDRGMVLKKTEKVGTGKVILTPRLLLVVEPEGAAAVAVAPAVAAVGCAAAAAAAPSELSLPAAPPAPRPAAAVAEVPAEAPLLPAPAPRSRRKLWLWLWLAGIIGGDPGGVVSPPAMNESAATADNDAKLRTRARRCENVERLDGSGSGGGVRRDKQLLAVDMARLGPLEGLPTPAPTPMTASGLGSLGAVDDARASPGAGPGAEVEADAGAVVEGCGCMPRLVITRCDDPCPIACRPCCPCCLGCCCCSSGGAGCDCGPDSAAYPFAFRNHVSAPLRAPPQISPAHPAAAGPSRAAITTSTSAAACASSGGP